MEHCISWNGKLICISKRSPHILSTVYTFDCRNRSWEREDSFEIGDSDKIEIVQCRVRTELSIGLRLPVLLIKFIDEGTSQNVYFLAVLKVHDRKLFYLKKLKTCSLIHNRNVFIYDGPSALWIDGSSVLISKKDKNNACLLNESILLNRLNSPNILWVENIKNVLVIIGNQTKVLDKGEECLKNYPFVFTVNLINDETIPLDSDVSVFYPSEYTNFVCIRVTKCEFSKRNGNVTEEKLNFETEIFALTNEGYVLHFVNGKLVTAVPIEEEDIDQDACIHVVKPFSLGYDFVIVRGKQLIHAVDIRDSKVTTSWSNISHVICDDFVGCGSTQILLLTNDFDCSWNNNWILTDFGVWQIDLEKDKRSKQEFDDKDNVVTAVDALRSRLQNDLVLYEEKKRTVSQRNIFILETWRRLQYMNSHSEIETCERTNPETTSTSNEYELVNLLGNCQTFKGELSFKKPQELIQVTDIWQKAFNGKWIVGIDFINYCKRTMVCQSLSLIPNVNSVSLLQVDLLTTSGYQSNSFDDSKSERLIFSEDIGGHLAPKRRKLSSTDLSEQLQELLPLAHGTVISFCDIPKFGQLSSYNCYWLLHWNERREEDDSEVTEENIISKSKCVGEVCLTLQDVLTSKHDIDLEECLIHDSEENKKNIECLNAVQIPTRLLIQSVHSVLTNLAKWFKEKIGFHYVKQFKCYVTTQVRPLSSVRVILDPNPGVRKTSITVYTCNEEEVCIFVQHLYSCLPDDIIILQDTSDGFSEKLKMAKSCMREEITFMTSAIKDLSSKGGNISNAVATVEEEVDEKGDVDIEKVRKSFKRKKITQNTNQEWKNEEFNHLCENLRQRQKKTDKIIIEMTT